MGKDGHGLRKVSSISMSNVVQRSLNALRSADKSLISPLVWISVIPASESATLHLLAITKSGEKTRVCCTCILYRCMCSIVGMCTSDI